MTAHAGVSTMTVKVCDCRVCDHRWQPRKPVTAKTRCPSCSTQCWNRERKKAGRPRKWMRIPVDTH